MLGGSPIFIEQLPLNLVGIRGNFVGIIFGIAGEGGVVGFVICHQGAELLSAEGEIMGVLAIFGDFKAI